MTIYGKVPRNSSHVRDDLIQRFGDELLHITLENKGIEDLTTPKLASLRLREASFIGGILPRRPNNVKLMIDDFSRFIL